MSAYEDQVLELLLTFYPRVLARVITGYLDFYYYVGIYWNFSKDSLDGLLIRSHEMYNLSNIDSYCGNTYLLYA